MLQDERDFIDGGSSTVNERVRKHYRDLVNARYIVAQGDDALDEDDFVMAWHLGQFVDLHRNGKVYNNVVLGGFGLPAVDELLDT